MRDAPAKRLGGLAWNAAMHFKESRTTMSEAFVWYVGDIRRETIKARNDVRKTAYIICMSDINRRHKQLWQYH